MAGVGICQRYRCDEMWPISTPVNKPENDDADLLTLLA